MHYEEALAQLALTYEELEADSPPCGWPRQSRLETTRLPPRPENRQFLGNYLASGVIRNPSKFEILGNFMSLSEKILKT